MPSEKDFYQVSLKVFLKNNRGEILILKCRQDSIFVGFYDLPGGRIEVDEFFTPFNEIIKREVVEEISDIDFELSLKPLALSRVEIQGKESPLGGPRHALFVFFEARYLGGDIKISEEHTDFQWIKLIKENMEQYFAPAFLEGIKMYLEKYEQ